MHDKRKRNQRYEILEHKQKSTQMYCTTLKATMTDQLQQYGQNKADLNAEITRLQGQPVPVPSNSPNSASLHLEMFARYHATPAISCVFGV